MGAIRKALDAFIENDVIGVNAMIDIALNLDNNKGVKSKKVIVSTSKSKVKNPKAKQNALEYFNDYLSNCNDALSSSDGLDDIQMLIVQGLLNSHFEKPLLSMLTKETSNAVREEAFIMLKHIKKIIG